jgi:hypothetical protein
MRQSCTTVTALSLTRTDVLMDLAVERPADEAGGKGRSIFDTAASEIHWAFAARGAGERRRQARSFGEFQESCIARNLLIPGVHRPDGLG